MRATSDRKKDALEIAVAPLNFEFTCGSSTAACAGGYQVSIIVLYFFESFKLKDYESYIMRREVVSESFSNIMCTPHTNVWET